MTAQFATDLSVQEQYVDLLDAAAGAGVISVPITNFLATDTVNSVLLTITGTGLTTIALTVDKIVRAQGQFYFTDASSVLAQFTLTNAQIAAIAAATNGKYTVQVSVTRGTLSYTREVQAGNLSARPASPATPNIVNTIAITGGPVIAAINGTVQLTAVGYDGLGNIVSGATFTWATSDATIATVSATGLVTVKAVGTATITATSYGVTANTTASAGSTPFPAGAVVYASATNALGFAAIGTPNQFLAVNGGGTAPAFKTLTAADVAAGTFPAGAYAFQGGLSGVTSLSIDGALTVLTDNARDLGAVASGRFRDFYLARNAVVGGTVTVSGTITGTLVNALTFGAHLTGGSYNNSGAVSLATDATAANTVGTIVARDGSGNFAAGTITASLTGTASNASAVPASGITGTTLASNVVSSSLTAFGTLAANVLFVDGLYDIGQSAATRPRHGYFSGNVTAASFIGALSGNASTATALATPRTINTVAFDGTGNITVTAAAGTLTGTVLNATVVTSSLTAVGTIGTGVWQGTQVADAFLAALSASKLTGAALPANLTSSSLQSFGTLGADVLFTDGLYDIGKSGATRPRDLFISRNGTVGGTLTVVGSTTLATVAAGTWNGTAIGATFGGTGLTAYTLGDTLYSNGANTVARLAGNTTVTKKWLSQTGDGANSAAPAWGQVLASDVVAGTFAGSMGFSGAVSLSSTLSVTGTATLAAATFSGVATFNNGLALGSPLTWTVDNTYDVGANGASRPRDIYAGRNLTIGGALAMNGALSGVTSLTMSGAFSGTTGTFSSTLGVTGIASLLASTLTLGTDVAGANTPATPVTVTAPRSTGTAAPAGLVFQVTRTTGSGASLQSWANNLTLLADQLALGQNASGLNAAATAYVISAAVSTGNATPATLTIQTGHVGGSSSSAQSLDNLVIFGDRVMTVLSTATWTLGGTSVTTSGVVATNLTGTLQTAAQPNVTSLGTLAADLLFVDATYDIGKAGATRPRDVFLSRNLTAGGTATITGAATLQSTLSVTGTSTFNAAASFTTISAASISTSAGITVATTLGVTGLSTLSGGATVGTLLNFSADNTYDIAAAGSGRPRDVFIGRNLTVSGTLSVTGATTVTTPFTINGAAGANRELYWATSASNRWRARANAIAESGANAGSNWALDAFDDAAVLIDSPISIVRASGGAVTLARPVTLGGNLIWTTDNANDIGASGANRARDFFLARNAVIGGNLTVSGNTGPLITATSGAGADGKIARYYYGSGNNIPLTIGINRSNGDAWLGWNAVQGAADAQAYDITGYAARFRFSGDGTLLLQSAPSGAAAGAITWTTALTHTQSTNAFTFAQGFSVTTGTTAVQALTATSASLTTTGSNTLVVNRGDAAGVNGLIELRRAGTAKFYVGFDASDNYVIYDSGPTARATLTSAGALTLTAGITATTATFSSSGANVAVTATTAPYISLDSTSGATSDNATIFFKRGGAIKWRIGNNITGTNVDALNIYNDALGNAAFTLANTTGAATFVAGITATSYTVGANQVVGARRTGWTAQTAAASRADLGATPTVGALASFCRAMYDDLVAHGLIGP